MLRYVACRDGQRVGRRDGDVPVTHPHPHYAWQPIVENHRHERSCKCSKIRDDISECETSNFKSADNVKEVSSLPSSK